MAEVRGETPKFWREVLSLILISFFLAYLFFLLKSKKPFKNCTETHLLNLRASTVQTYLHKSKEPDKSSQQCLEINSPLPKIFLQINTDFFTSYRVNSLFFPEWARYLAFDIQVLMGYDTEVSKELACRTGMWQSCKLPQWQMRAFWNPTWNFHFSRGCRKRIPFIVWSYIKIKKEESTSAQFR